MCFLQADNVRLLKTKEMKELTEAVRRLRTPTVEGKDR
jgi:hypothetical protein